MHCKIFVSLLIVFFFFSFFSSACYFRFIEGIGAHGKQNPDFIIIIMVPVDRWLFSNQNSPLFEIEILSSLLSLEVEASISK